jgi:hypothetical protein
MTESAGKADTGAFPERGLPNFPSVSERFGEPGAPILFLLTLL